MNKSVTNLLKILRMEEVKALGYKTNDAAYLYCQLRFYKEYLEEQYVEIQEEKDEFKEYYVLSNYTQHLIKGFEECCELGNVMTFVNSWGRKHYDQFNWRHFLNQKK